MKYQNFSASPNDKKAEEKISRRDIRYRMNCVLRYCIDGCPEGDRCPYNAVKLYLDDKENDWFRSTCARTVNPTDEQIEHALRTTQYGKCVFRCDNGLFLLQRNQEKKEAL